MSLVIEGRRGGRTETVHPVSACVVEGGVVGGGRILHRVGEDVASYWRSASKPVQLEVSLSRLPASLTEGLTDRELAIGAASHSGEPDHTALVEALLRKLGGNAAELQCGAHPPMHEPSAKLVPEPTQLHSNCSGKHTFMLSACRASRFPLDYRPIDHPLQEAIRRRLDEVAAARHEHAIDGCSVPTFFAPLSAMARTWAEIARAMAAHEGWLARIGWAMHREPWWMSGTGRLDLSVARGASEPVAVKIGAEGLFCVAVPGRRVGVAIKCHTGNQDALAVAVKAVLADLGITIAGDFPWETVLNVRGVVAGERVAVRR